MELPGQQTYPFYDGDFTFWMADYAPNHRVAYRVRIDTDPEQRFRDNQQNHNSFSSHKASIVPAPDDHIENWLWQFRKHFPLRPPLHTEVLRLLKLHGPLHLPRESASSDEIEHEMALYSAARVLAGPLTLVIDFEPIETSLVKLNPGPHKYDELGNLSGDWELTEHGKWLCKLIR